jgi:hypothetical protein
MYNHNVANHNTYLPSTPELLPPPQHARPSVPPPSGDRNYERKRPRNEYHFHYPGNGPMHNERRDMPSSSYVKSEGSWRSNNTNLPSSHFPYSFSRPHDSSRSSGHFESSYASPGSVTIPNSPPPMSSYPSSRLYSGGQDRSSITNHSTALPPLHGQYDSYSMQAHDDMGEIQTASRAERPNGQDKFGHQFQPPPPAVPMQDQWYSSSYSVQGYHGAAEYHGSG